MASKNTIPTRIDVDDVDFFRWVAAKRRADRVDKKEVKTPRVITAARRLVEGDPKLLKRLLEAEFK